jgi:hypothetical protein
MNRVAKVVGVVGVLVVGALVGSSYWVGGYIEDSIRQGMYEKFPAAQDMVTLDYERGVFSSNVRATIKMEPDKGDTYNWIFTSRISHGPLPVVTGMARIHAELLLPEVAAQELVKDFGSDPFGGQAPLQVDAHVGWDNSATFTYFSPDFEALADGGKTRIWWGGLKGESSGVYGRNGGEARLEVPGLAISNDEFTLRLDRVALTGKITAVEGYVFVMNIATTLSVDKLAFRLNKDAEDEDDDEEEGEDGEASGEEVSDEVVYSVDLEHFTLDVNMAMNEGNETFNYSIAPGAAKVAAFGVSAENVGLTFAVENITARGYEDFQKFVMGGAPDFYKNSKIIDNYLPAFLKHKPIYAIRNIHALFPEGDIKGDFQIGYVGNGEVDQFDPMRDLSAALKLSLPRALLARLNQDDKIDTLIEHNVLLDKEGILSVEARFKDGLLDINGEEQSLAAWGHALKGF